MQTLRVRCRISLNLSSDNIESKIIRALDELCVYVFIDKCGIGAGTMILSNKDIYRPRTKALIYVFYSIIERKKNNKESYDEFFHPSIANSFTYPFSKFNRRPLHTFVTIYGDLYKPGSQRGHYE